MAAGDIGGQGIGVRQEAVAEPVEGELGFVGPVALVRPEEPHLAVRELPVDAQQRAEGGELEPAGDELAPLLDVLGSGIGLRPLARNGEAAHVRGPPGNPGEGEVEAGRDLLAQHVPVRSDVARPGGRGVALDAGEGRSGEDEDALARVGAPLPLVDRLAAGEDVGIRHARARAQGGRVHGRLQGLRRALPHELGLGRVHPPRVDALAEEGVVHLLPEQLARLGVEGVVEGVRVAQPVLGGALQGLRVEEAPLLHRAEVQGGGVELRPDRDHEPGREALVDLADPSRRIGEPLGVELVRPPLVLPPVLPVLDDGVQGDPPPPEFGEGVEALLRRLVALAALPQAEGPARHDRSPPRELAIARDHGIEVGAVDEVVVDAVADLGPERGVGAPRRRLPLEAQRGLVVLATPLETQRVSFRPAEPHAYRVPPGQPGLAPGIDEEPAVDPQPDAVAGEGQEVVVPRRLAFELPLPDDAGRTGPQGGVNLGVRRLRGLVDLGDRGPILRSAEGDLGIATRGHHIAGGAVALFVGAVEAARSPLGVQKPKGGHVHGLPQVAETRVRRVVPEHSVASVRDEEGNDVDGVELEHVDVPARVVHEAALVRAEAVVRLVHDGFELGLRVVGGLAHDLGGNQGLSSTLLLREQHAAFAVEEGDLTLGQGDSGRQRSGRHRHGVSALLDLERRGSAGAAHGHQGRAREVGAGRSVDHAGDLVATDADLEPALAQLHRDAVLQSLHRRPGRGRNASPGPVAPATPAAEAAARPRPSFSSPPRSRTRAHDSQDPVRRPPGPRGTRCPRRLGTVTPLRVSSA